MYHPNCTPPHISHVQSERVWAYVRDSIQEPLLTNSSALMAFDLALSHLYVTWTLSGKVSVSYPLYLCSESVGHGYLGGIIADELVCQSQLWSHTEFARANILLTASSPSAPILSPSFSLHFSYCLCTCPFVYGWEACQHHSAIIYVQREMM